VILEMGAELGWGLAEKARHSGQVAFHVIQVHQKGRCVKLVCLHCSARYSHA